MEIDELHRLKVMALGTDLTACNLEHRFILRAVGLVAGGAIFRRRGMQGTLTPILGDFAMAFETESGLVLTLVIRMR